MNQITVYKPQLPAGWENLVPIAMREAVKNFDSPQIRSINPEAVRKVVATGIVRLSASYRKPMEDSDILSISQEVTSHLLTAYPAIRRDEILNVFDGGIRGDFGALHDLSAITPSLILNWVRAYYKGEEREKVRHAYLKGRNEEKKEEEIDFQGMSEDEFGRYRLDQLREDYKSGKELKDYKLLALHYLIRRGDVELSPEDKMEIRERARERLATKYLVSLKTAGEFEAKFIRKRIENLKDDAYIPLKTECSAIVLREYFEKE